MSIRLKEVPNVLVRNYMSGTNTMLRGKPALGKTETIMAFAEKMVAKVDGFKVWKFYAPTMSPMDIQASAPDYEAGTLRLFNNEALPNAYTHPDLKGIVFFGELPNADPTTAKLLQKYVNGEDMSGVLRKPDGVVIVADGNRIEDKSGVQQQYRAFLSRFEQHDVFSDAQDNLDYAAKAGWHPLVQTFLKENPAMIDNYDEVFETTESARSREKGAKHDKMSEEGKLGIWANMRSWQRISKKEYAADELSSPLLLSEIAGNLGSGVAAAYVAHKTMIGNLVSFDEIMADPANVELPKRPDEQYALGMILALKCTPEQLDKVHTFGKRLPTELQATVLRTMVQRKGFNLAASKAYMQWISDAKLVGLLQGKV